MSMTSDMGEVRATSGRAIRVRNERHNEDLGADQYRSLGIRRDRL